MRPGKLGSGTGEKYQEKKICINSFSEMKIQVESGSDFFLKFFPAPIGIVQ